MGFQYYQIVASRLLVLQAKAAFTCRGVSLLQIFMLALQPAWFEAQPDALREEVYKQLQLNR